MEVVAPDQVTWESVVDTARSLFNVWAHGRELTWAQHAWGHLTSAGLTHYSSELERCEVAIRLMALASLYRDWCSLADDEDQDDELTWWADELEITSFRLGQLVGPDFGEDDEDEDELQEAALEHLVSNARDTGFEALLDAYGGDDALFLALWRINHPAPPEPKPRQPTATDARMPATEGQTTLFPDLESAPPQPSLFDEAPDKSDTPEEPEDEQEDDEFGGYEDDGAVLNNLTDEKARAHGWISDGCPKVRR